MDDDGTSRNDERVVTGIELADAVSQAFESALAESVRPVSETHPDRECLFRYINGKASRDELLEVVNHLTLCSTCRAAVHTLMAALGVSDGGECRLVELINMLVDWPEAAAAGLAHVSRRIDNLILPNDMRARPVHQLRVEALDANGQQMGKAMTFLCQDGPRIDQSRQFHLSLEGVQTAPTLGALTLAIIDDAGIIVLGEAEARVGTIEMRVDLSVLSVQAGFLPPESLGGRFEIRAAPRGVETSGLAATTTTTSPLPRQVSGARHRERSEDPPHDAEERRRSQGDQNDSS